MTESLNMRKDTLCPDLGQSLYLTRAAGERLSHYKEEVGVFYPLCVEQPIGDSDGQSRVLLHI